MCNYYNYNYAACQRSPVSGLTETPEWIQVMTMMMMVTKKVVMVMQVTIMLITMTIILIG